MNRDESLLRDEIELREASLADAQREVDAGELSAASFATIAKREQAAINNAQEKLAVLSRSTPDARKSGRRRRGRCGIPTHARSCRQTATASEGR